jgi:hypothetical protein
MTDDVPLICDPVPTGGNIPTGVLVANRLLSNAEIDAFRAEWERATQRGGCVVLPDGCHLTQIFEPPQWPDAEFCAA